MELTQENYSTKSSRHRVFGINGASAVSVVQMSSVDDTTLWSEPRMHTFAVRLVDMEHADLFKDALELGVFGSIGSHIDFAFGEAIGRGIILCHIAFLREEVIKERQGCIDLLR